MDPSPAAVEAARKIVAALKTVRVQAVAVGDAACQVWGSSREPKGLDLLSPTGERQRQALLNAAHAQGLQPDEGLRLRHKTAYVRVVEAATPFHRQVLARALPGVVLQTRFLTARLEDLLLLLAEAGKPEDREVIVELLRKHAGKFDGPYLKREAEAAGTFDAIKGAWQEAKRGT